MAWSLIVQFERYRSCIHRLRKFNPTGRECLWLARDVRIWCKACLMSIEYFYDFMLMWIPHSYKSYFLEQNRIGSYLEQIVCDRWKNRQTHEWSYKFSYGIWNDIKNNCRGRFLVGSFDNPEWWRFGVVTILMTPELLKVCRRVI